MARYSKVSQGQELVFSASMHNDTIDLLEKSRSVPNDRNRRVAPAAQAVVVWIRNNSGADRARWDCMALDLGGPSSVLRWPITDGNETPIWNAVASDHDKDPVILQEPIAANKFGRAVVFGYTLAKVQGGSGDRATPTASHNLTPGVLGSVRLLAAPTTVGGGVTTLVPCLIGFGAPATILAMTPSIGIPPRTPASGSPPFTFFGRTCDLVSEFGALIPGRTAAVYNSTSITIPGNSLIQAKRIGSRYFVDVDNC